MEIETWTGAGSGEKRNCLQRVKTELFLMGMLAMYASTFDKTSKLYIYNMCMWHI